MKKKEILEILKENKYGWCEKEVRKAIKYVSNFSDKATIEEIAEGIPEMWAYYWGLYIGDRKIMRNKITDSAWAYCWARDIGDRDIMINKITESKYAYWWAKVIGNKDVMINRVTDLVWINLWAITIGDKEIMSEKALKLGVPLGDKETMKIVKELESAYRNSEG